MKLSISNIAWDSAYDFQMYQLMKEYGYTGLEIAPTKIFSENPYDKLKEAREWSERLKKEYDFSISSMQSIWFGRQENMFDSDKERQVLIDYTKRAIDFARIIGCKNIVFGSPKNRNMDKNLNKEEAEEKAVKFFRELADYAYNSGTIIGMEANPTIYQTNYINDTVSALNLIKEVNSKGFLLNLDIGTVIQNSETIKKLAGEVKYINHIHISEPGLKVIEKKILHNELKDIIIDEGYDKFISIEMSKIENLDKIEEVMKYISEVF